jgi:hypothetical protein
MGKQATKMYTVSTYVFRTLDEAEEQVEKWHKDGTLKEGTKIMEITGATFAPTTKIEFTPVELTRAQLPRPVAFHRYGEPDRRDIFE